MNPAIEGGGDRSRRFGVSRPWGAALLVFLLAAPLLWAFYSRHPLLYDTDSSYHLALARATAEAGGRLSAFPAVRFSALTTPAFSDAAWLFHLLLAPFSTGPDPMAGGRLALALFDALLLAVIAGLAVRAAGAWGLLAPLWIGLGSLETAWRLVRLRPELLSCLLLLLALGAAGSRRYRLLGLLAGLYSLAYVAWHAFVGLFVLLFGLRGIFRRRWDWALALYPILGAGLGLALHPNFPANLGLWKLVAFDFLRTKGVLDSGTETGPPTLTVMLLANLGFWGLAAVLWRSRARGERVPSSARTDDDPAAPDVGRPDPGFVDAFGLATLCFGGLYLLMERFALYVFPFAALWLLFLLARRGEAIGERFRLPFRGSLPLPAALLLAALPALPGTWQEARRFTERTSAGPGGVRLTDRQDFGRAVPPGATIAAPWGDTSTYLLYAPQGRYLNVLDPVAMAMPFPRAYQAQRTLFAGEEPDVPYTALAELDSRFLAWSLPGAPRRLLSQLRGDPRARPLHLGFQALFAFAPPPPGTFVLDWKVVPEDAPLTEVTTANLPDYPRPAEPALREMEGFVDTGRVRRSDCVVFFRPGPGLPPGSYELAGAGPTRLYHEDGPIVDAGGSEGALLGEGRRFVIAPGQAGSVSVKACPGPGGRGGFYLVHRP